AWGYFAGPAAISGSTLAFTIQASVPISGGIAYNFEIYAASPYAPAPTPPPGPSNAFTLVGTQTQTFTYKYGYPSPQPSAIIDTAVTENVIVTPTTLPSPGKGAGNDVHVAETDVVGSLQTVSTTGDAYTYTNGNDVLLVGSDEIVPSVGGNAQSTQETTIYGTPQIVDETSGSSGSWTNSPAATLTWEYGDGHSETRTIAADGSYSEKGYAQAANGSGLTAIDLIESATGAGSYSGPFLGYQAVAFAFPAPAGTPPFIDSTLSIDGKAAKPYVKIPAWYTGNPDPTLYTESDSSKEVSAPPAFCNVPTGSSLTDVQQLVTRLDTIIGYEESSERDVYADATGPVCVRFSDTLENYYDWNGDTQYFFVPSFTGKPISEVVTAESLAFPAPSVSANRRSHALVADPALADEAIAGASARFQAKMEATRRALLERLVRYFASKPVQGGVR
ncbi:MAG TPA: hypothetical protein VMH02_02395, partial [Verrucomicrobiae bacterium]|nr:hypothetical protein [Verrucomicrobiae bacterium]